jgi:hypothetical protein
MTSKILFGTAIASVEVGLPKKPRTRKNKQIQKAKPI